MIRRLLRIALVTVAVMGSLTAAVPTRTTAASAPVPSATDMEGIREARTIVRTVGDRLWPHWSTTPFTLDLLTPDYEILLDATGLPKGFATLPNGATFRKRTFPSDLEATFPAFGATPIVVIGEPPLTAAKTTTRWVVTLLHEHFHQWQDLWPPYYGDVRALRLAHGDRTGMWMLDYAFPYGSSEVDANFKRLAVHLSTALRARGTPRFRSEVETYRQVRAAWRAALKPEDYRYFAFQCWQEGVARYTEVHVAQLAARAHAADPAFLTPSQALLLDNDARRTYARILRNLETASLSRDRRDAFYSVGAGEALLLDRTSADWRARYLDARMDLSLLR